MTRVSDWSEEEFEVLLSNPLLTEADLSQLLPQHTPGAIAVVRQGVHSWHTGRNDHHTLSAMMKQRLMAPSRPLLCALCKQLV